MRAELLLCVEVQEVLKLSKGSDSVLEREVAPSFLEHFEKEFGVWYQAAIYANGSTAQFLS